LLDPLPDFTLLDGRSDPSLPRASHRLAAFDAITGFAQCEANFLLSEGWRSGLGSGKHDWDGLSWREAARMKLVVVEGPDAGTSVDVRGERFVVGRGEGCDMTLGDPDVSRRHLEIRNAGSGFEVADLGSSNGTQVDGQPLSDMPLRDGARIRLGSTLLMADESSGLSDAPTRIQPTIGEQAP
jgi:FHA domain-containing protein